jgi:hypothetical protein
LTTHVNTLLNCCEPFVGMPTSQSISLWHQLRDRTTITFTILEVKTDSSRECFSLGIASYTPAEKPSRSEPFFLSIIVKVIIVRSLREIALIAAINGHDVNDPEVQMKMLSCLVGGDLMKASSLTVKLIVKELAKNMLADMGITSSLPVTFPVQMMFNYFTNNSAKVATHAKLLFVEKK